MIDNVALVRNVYEAYHRGHFAAVFAQLHPEIEIRQTELLPWGGIHRGLDGAREFFRILAEHTDGQPEPEQYISAGDDVVVIAFPIGRRVSKRPSSRQNT